MIEKGQNVEASRRESAYVERWTKLTEQQQLASGDWEAVVMTTAESPILRYYRAVQMAKRQNLEEPAALAEKFLGIVEAETK